MNDVKKLTAEDVISAYSGKSGNACCCGCKGKYYRRDEGGNALTQVRRILRIVQAAEKTKDNGGGVFSTEIGGRIYIVYVD